MRAKFMQAANKVTVDQLELAGPDIKLAASGSMDWADGPHLKYGLTLSETPMRAIMRLWPSHVEAATRAWFLEHVAAGVVRSGTLAADLDNAALTAIRFERAAPDAAIRADFEIADATILALLPGLPPFTGVAGQAHITGHTSRFLASAGAMETAPGHRLVLSEGSFVAPETDVNPTPTALDMRLSGNVEAVADVLAVESVAPFASLPLESGVLKDGQIDGRLRVDFELGAAARSERTAVAIDAETSNLSIERFIGKERLENAALKVVADRSGLHVAGAGRLFGAPATLDIRRQFGERGPAQAQVSLVFDEATRAKAGFGAPGVAGPINVAIKTPVPVEDTDAQIELDLTKAALNNPLPGLTKPAGTAGKATFRLVKRPEGLTLEQFTLDGSAAQASGVVELTRDGAFRSAKLSQMRLSPGDDARVEATRSGDALKLVVRGVNIDARPVLQFLMQADSAPPSGERFAAGGAKSSLSFDDLDLDFKSPIVSGYGRQILSNVELKLERRGGRPRALSLSGSFGREPLAAALTRSQNSGPQIEVSTSDGGSLLSFLDLYPRMDGGVLNASVALGQSRADGVLHIRDFYLKNEPTMRQLMTQGAARADNRGVVHFDPDSVMFSRLQAGFTWSGGRLGLREGVMSGPEIGLTVDGYVDFARDHIDVSGAYVPAYALNNLLSNIPVLGLILVGGRHEGVFALNYGVSGSIDGPVLTVNPLSAIAPG
ncbi:MAG: hypothetical protein HYZ60_03360, partial [Methylocystis sp.]|nr:hypothetical protein [Methylocystis sp.]